MTNPWSDWHDDEKLQRLAGPELRILQRETYHEDRFVWYVLGRSADHPAAPATPIVDLAGLEARRFRADLAHGRMVHDVDLSAASVIDARVTRDAGGIRVQTASSQFHYALSFSNLSSGAAPPPNRLVVEGSIASGGFSVSLLDVYANSIFYTASIHRTGGVRIDRDLSHAGWPALYRVVVANYCPAGAAISEFSLQRIALVRAPDGQ